MAITLQNLRRSLALRTGQPFATQVGDSKTATGGSTTTLIDTVNLGQETDAWKHSYIYFPSSQETRRITSSVSGTQTLTWVGAISTAVVNGREYEIWSQFSPRVVHQAINQALRDAWPWFFNVTENFLVIQNDVGTGYTISSLSPAPRWLASVYLELMANSFTGQATHTVATNRLKDTNRTFVAADVGKSVRIYDGTSQGDRRTISSLVDTNTVEVSTAFTSALDTTSKYRVVEALDESHGYSFFNQWSVDKFTFPSTLRLGGHPHGREGYLLRLLYESEFTALSAEADSTDAPQEWLELAALARMYMIKISASPSSELKNWGTMYQVTSEAAAQFAAKNRFAHLASTYNDDQQGLGRTAPEYPF